MNLLSFFKPYSDRRMLRILLLGIMSGFPWVLIGSALSLWLKENDLSRTTIGWAGLIFAVYAINFLWAPLIDRLHLPFLSKKIGHRKSWIILMQLIIFVSLLLWSLLDPTKNLWLVIAVGLGIAISSATQDITIDALRIEQIGENEKNLLSAGAAISVVGWWTGYKIGGLVSLVSADILQKQGVENYWQISFLILSGIIALCCVGLLFIPEKNSDEKINSQNISDQKLINKIGVSNIFTRIFAWLYGTIINPLLSFFKKNTIKKAIGILGFIYLFKIGE
jgi:PAT family beta-lactamase induction signal transducer AmpG